MKKFLCLTAPFVCQVLLCMTSAAQNSGGQRPLVLSDAVLPTPSKNPLLDPRIFNPEFYRKFNPGLGLTTDQEAIQQWTNAGANHCLRASFSFYAADYLRRYVDLSL